jgi:hypothetical protein
VAKAVSTEGFNKLEALLYRECMFKIDNDSVTTPDAKDLSGTIELKDEENGGD